MHLQERHWTQLFGHLTTVGSSWCGLSTSYSPDKQVLRHSKMIRTLRANEDKTIITHTNQVPLPDGTVQEKQWQIEKATCDRPDGLAHPADPTKRGLALLDKGISAWICKTFEPGKNFGVEFFLKHEDWNSSIGIIYGENGSLDRIFHLREHLGSFPETPMGPEITHLAGNWRGKKESMTPDLQLLPAEEIGELALEPTTGKNQTFFLPDGLVVNAPQTIQVGEAIELVAGKLVSENEYKRLTVQYDNSAVFSLLISEVFRREA